MVMIRFLNRIKSFIFKESFNPSYIRILSHPFFFARRDLFKFLSKLSLQLHGKVLDIGCGTKPYQKYCLNSNEYIGIEIDTPENRKNKNADCFYDGKTFPFHDKSFDSVLSTQVFEHVFNPDDFLKELNRVLKINGKLLLTIPFVWDEHEQPFDFARYSSFGIKHLLEKNGFSIIESHQSVNNISCIFQLFNNYVYKKTISGNILKKLIKLLLIPLFNTFGLVFKLITPKNNDLYLDNIILAKKVTDA